MMEELLPITNINDFLFCPRSLYFGNVYRRSLAKDEFQEAPQKIGQAAHQRIDDGSYSTRKTILTGMMVCCEKFGLIGRIDIYDAASKTLTERKWAVSAVWEGFRMQLYAQQAALEEISLPVESLRLHSQKDNKNYDVPLPNDSDWNRLKEILAQMRAFRLDAPFTPNPRKCAGCIYRELCDVYSEEAQAHDVIA